MDSTFFARTRTHNAKRHLWRTIATAIVLPASLAGFSSARADNLEWNVAGSGDWDTTSVNWFNTGTLTTDTYTDGGVDDVNFITTAGSTTTRTITVDAGGVTPLSVTVTGTGVSTFTNYIITGGSIGGTTSLVHESEYSFGGAGALLTLTGPNTFSGGVTLGVYDTKGSILESRDGDSFGTGTITLNGGSGNAGSTIRFTTNSQVVDNDIVTNGPKSTNHNFDVRALTRLTGNLTLNNDSFRLVPGGAGVARPLEIRPAAGKSVTGTSDVIMQHAILSLSAANEIPTGLLDIGDRSVVILDNLSWAGFGRTQGTGTNNWKIIASGGFAAKGTALTITSGDFSGGFSLGYGDTSYADQPVTIDLPSSDTITLTANRTFRTYGNSVISATGWTINGPLHEFADPISGSGRTLTIESYNNTNNSAIQGGQLRLSNAANVLGTLQLSSTSYSAILVADSDAALGTSDVRIGNNVGNTYGMLFLDDRAGTGQTFTPDITISQGASPSLPQSGFGAWSGTVTYKGHVILNDDPTKADNASAGAVVVQAQGSSSLILGTGATAAWFENDRQNSTAGWGALYRKAGTGEVVLRNIDYTTGSFNSLYKWQLFDGTLTSENPALLADTTITLNDLLAASVNANRKLHIAAVDHTYSNVASTSFLGSPTVEVDSGITFTTNLLTGNRLYGSTAGAQTLTKTGGGTWVLNSSTALSGTGDTTDRFQIDAGVLDVRGDTGNAGFTINGGTLLVADLSGFVSGRALDITSAGGKIGVSVNATANVTRSATAINSWTQGGTVTFASRDNYNLAFTNAGFPDITAGTVLFERDGTGSGVVQINDTAVDVSGANTRVGGSGEVRFGSTGTGTWTFSDGTLAPGSSPGILTVDGNIVLTSAAAFEAQINGTTVGTQYDQLALSAASAHSITLGNADLLLDFGYFPGLGDTFVIINNQHASGTTSGLFTYNASTLLDDQEFLTSYNGNPFKLTIDYNGGIDGNDVILTTTFIPEPASLALLAAGGLMVLGRRRGK